MDNIRAQIIRIAKDKFAYQVWAIRTNKKEQAVFRRPSEMTPFGFDFHGVSIEVHPLRKKNVLISGFNRFLHLPVLHIIGIRKDGERRVIAQEVTTYVRY